MKENNLGVARRCAEASRRAALSVPNFLFISFIKSIPLQSLTRGSTVSRPIT
jgi:hypothetical protein